LQKFEQRGRDESARRLRAVAGMVFRYARRFSPGCGVSDCRPWAAAGPASRATSLADESLRACRSVPVIANIARMASQLIRALDYKSLLVLGRGDAARHVDCPCLSEKAPAGNFKRGPHTPTPPAISARRARRAFPLPSSSSAQRLLHATTFPDAETSTHASHAHGDCSRCIGQ